MTTSRSNPFVTARLPSSHCPSCDHEVDAASGEGVVPRPGDLTVCMYCAAINSFNDDMTVRPTTDEELATLDPRDRLKMDEYVSTIRTHNLLKSL